jgi:hypothetical protein
VRSFFLALVITGVLTASESAQADAVACDPQKSHVSVAFIGEFSEEIREGALSDLSAALLPQRLGVCQDSQVSGVPKSVSLVKLELLEGSRVRIEVDDSLTDKTVARDIRLEDPKDSASALIIAVAIDELLRATWAELSIKEAPPKEPERAPLEPPEPQASRPPTKSDPAGFPVHRVAVEGALDAFVEGSAFFGANIVYGSSFFGRLEWDAFAGPRVVRAKNASQLGQVRADAVAFGAEVGLPVIATSDFYFGPELGLGLMHAWFRGQAESNAERPATGSEFQGWSFTARAGMGARLHFGGAFLGAATRVGYPLLALEVRDDSGVVGGMTGLEWSSGLSLGWWGR